MSVSILCNDCQSMNINIDRYDNVMLSTYIQSRVFNIYCLKNNACKWLNVNQYFLPNSSWNDSAIADYTGLMYIVWKLPPVDMLIFRILIMQC